MDNGDGTTFGAGMRWPRDPSLLIAPTSWPTTWRSRSARYRRLNFDVFRQPAAHDLAVKRFTVSTILFYCFPATRATMWVPGALGADFYKALAARVPEIDPDDFVADLAQLAVDEPEDGASFPDEDNE
jgi:hypothetical protein